MNLIAAVDRNWGIGNKGGLLAHIPEDMKFFREMTTGRVVIMGRRTLESFPNGRPLKNRMNLILSRQKGYAPKGAFVFSDIREVLKRVETLSPDQVFVIGGGEIYRAFLPYCKKAYITALDYVYDADTFMVNLDKEPGWRLVYESEEKTCFNLCYTFRRYERI